MSQQSAPSPIGTPPPMVIRGGPAVTAALSGTYALIGGLVTLVGWALDMPRLTDWKNDGISMFTNTAVCAIMGGVALLLLASNRGSARRNVTASFVARIAAGGMALIGGLTLLEHLSGLNFGIDTVLFDRPWGQRAAAAPMRMGPPASMSFLILGTAIFLATYNGRPRRLACALAILPIAITSLSLTGYWFGADHLFGVARLTGIAFQTSTMLAALGLGLIAAVPEHGLIAIIQRDDAGAVIIRRLMLPIIVIPLVLGRLRLLGQEAGLYDNAFGISLLVLTMVAMLVALLWWTASSISRQAQLASAAELALRESERRFKTLTSHAPVGIFQTDADGNALFVNERWCAMAGMSPEDARGKGWAKALHPQDRDQVLHEWYDAANAGREFASEYRFQTPQGSATWLSGSAVALRLEHGDIAGYIGTVTDITQRKRAERALRENEERYRAVVESQGEMLCRFRPDGTILFVNQAYACARGTTPEALMGSNFWDFISEEDRLEVQNMLNRLTPEAPEIRIENRFKTTKGDRWTLWTNRALAFDAGGQVIEAQSTGIDITDRKRAEETVRALLRISERLNSTLDVDALLDILVQEAISLVNAESGVSGLRTPEGMVCKKYFQKGSVLPLDYCWPIMHGLPGWLLVHKTPYLANDVRSDAQVIPELCDQFGVWSALSTPIVTAQGEVVGFFEIHNKQDGSGFTPSDKQLLLAVSQTAAIAVQNAMAYRSIQRVEESLKEADRRKDEFLATLAHELRNPLAPIRNALEIIKQASGAEELVKNARQMMERQLSHLVRLVDDLLDVSRITRDKLELRKERVELSSVIYQAIEATRPLADELEHELTVSLPPDPIYLEADLVRLAQVFSNLINNACKYTERHGKIWVSAEREGSDVVVKVKDSGVGIAPEMLPMVFQMFAQVGGSLKQSQGGLGIGLTLVKRLVELHGGSIQAQSEGLGEGSEFTVRLPVLIEVLNDHRAEPAAEESLLTGLRILVVDDNRDAATSLAMLLKMSGNEMCTAHDGLEALETAEAFRPDVVLLDIGMPNMNGYEVCRRIREHVWGKSIIMVAITGWGQEEDRRKSKEAGFDGHLVKPVELDALANQLASLALPSAREPVHRV